jgi:hypothetical protein
LGCNGICISPVGSSYADVATPFTGELCNCSTLGPDGKMDLFLQFSIPEINDKLNLLCSGVVPPTISGYLNQACEAKARLNSLAPATVPDVNDVTIMQNIPCSSNPTNTSVSIKEPFNTMHQCGEQHCCNGQCTGY